MTERRRSSVVQVSRADDGVARINDGSIRRLSIINPEVVQEFEEAKNAAKQEHELTVRDALRLYPKAIIFSIIFSSAVIMEGYDLSLMGSFFGFPVSVSLACVQDRISTASEVAICVPPHIYCKCYEIVVDDDVAFQKLLRYRRQSRRRAQYWRGMAVRHPERGPGW